MVDALSNALSALRLATVRRDVSANNVANLRTPGFVAQRVDAADVATGGVSVAAIRERASDGPIEITDRPVDLAIHGAGFFQVDTPNGTRFTRAGNFSPDAAGTLVDAQGNRVRGTVQIPAGATSIAIGGNGTVTAVLPNGTTQTAGQLELAKFPNPGGLLREGGNLLAPSPASGTAQTGFAGGGGFGTLVSGALEGSSVNLVDEIVGSIVDRTLFLANLATIRTERDMTGELLDIIR